MMQRTLARVLVGWLIIGTGGLCGSAAGSASHRMSPIVKAVARARPAVVNIHSQRTARRQTTDRWGTVPLQHRTNGMGTGIIIDPRGYIITNYHVIEGVSLLRVRLHDGTTCPARIIGRDAETDLALLKIDLPRKLETIPIGTSSDLMVGETVIAIGNAYGYAHTVTVGVISALNRDVRLNKSISYRSLIQTDASINPGNSGGPLLNVDGELIGVNVAIRAGAQGIGFAIPVDQMVEVATRLLRRRRGADVTLGMVLRNRVHVDDSPPWSVEAGRIEPAGPAARAGLRRGDRLLRVDTIDTANSLDVERALIGKKPGDEVTIRFERGGRRHAVKVTLASSLDGMSPAELAWRQLGMQLEPASRDQVIEAGSHLRGGLLVTAVDPGSPADRAGVRPGDILIGLHQWEIVSLDNVAYVLRHREVATFYPLRFYLVRDGQTHRGYLESGK